MALRSINLVFVLVLTFVFVTAPMFMLMFMFMVMPPSASPRFSGVAVPSVGRVRPVRPVKIRPMNADLPTSVITAPLTAD